MPERTMQWGELSQLADTLRSEEREALTKRRMFARSVVGRIGKWLQRPELTPLERLHLERAQRSLRVVANGGRRPERRATPERKERPPATKKRRRRRRRRRKKVAVAVAV